jgi:hypothetical protein
MFWEFWEKEQCFRILYFTIWKIPQNMHEPYYVTMDQKGLVTRTQFQLVEHNHRGPHLRVKFDLINMRSGSEESQADRNLISFARLCRP